MAEQGAKTTTETPAADPGMADPQHPPVSAGDVLDGGILDPPPPDDEEPAVFGERQEDDLTDQDFSSNDDEEEDDEDFVGGDSEFEEDDPPPPPALPPEVADGVMVARGTYRGCSAGAASFQTTVTFQRLDAFSCTAAAQGQASGGGEILVLYRYTRFLKAQSGGDGVDTHVLGPTQARLRFHVRSPVALNPSASLRLAGAALAPLVYPARFGKQLRTLWNVLVCNAPVSVPPQTTHLVVIVDAGILRPEDYTPERMDRVSVALSSLARERVTDHAPSPFFDAGVVEETVLQLPAPVESEDDVRPAKRRKVTGEDCPICCEALERGLVAWPWCSHIFHGRCLEPHLLSGAQQCPMCRTDLKLSQFPVVGMDTM